MQKKPEQPKLIRKFWPNFLFLNFLTIITDIADILSIITDITDIITENHFQNFWRMKFNKNTKKTSEFD